MLNALLLLRAQCLQTRVDLVHGRILRVVSRVNQSLNAAIIGELLPVVNILEHIVHRDRNFTARLRHHTRMVVLSAPIVENDLELVVVLRDLGEPLTAVLVTEVGIVHSFVGQHNVEN